MVHSTQTSLVLRRIRLVSTVLASALAISHAANAADLETAFPVVSIGASKSTVVLLLGQPTTQTETSTLGVSHTKLRWQPSSRGPAYVVTFVFDHVVSKAQCGNPADC